MQNTMQLTAIRARLASLTESTDRRAERIRRKAQARARAAERRNARIRKHLQQEG